MKKREKQRAKTVGLREVAALARGELPEKAVTTAHLEGLRFFRREYGRPQRQPSTLEKIARAVSPFALGELLEDCRRFTRPSTRAARSWRRAARARLAALRGEVLAPEELDG